MFNLNQLEEFMLKYKNDEIVLELLNDARDNYQDRASYRDLYEDAATRIDNLSDESDDLERSLRIAEENLEHAEEKLKKYEGDKVDYSFAKAMDVIEKSSSKHAEELKKMILGDKPDKGELSCLNLFPEKEVPKECMNQ